MYITHSGLHHGAAAARPTHQLTFIVSCIRRNVDGEGVLDDKQRASARIGKARVWVGDKAIIAADRKDLGKTHNGVLFVLPEVAVDTAIERRVLMAMPRQFLQGIKQQKAKGSPGPQALCVLMPQGGIQLLVEGDLVEKR